MALLSSISNKQLLQYKINYNKEQIFTFLCCLKRAKLWLPIELIEHIIMFLSHILDLMPLTLLLNEPSLLMDNSLNNLTETVYPYVKQLIEDKHKHLALENWNYKTIFETTEELHKDNKKLAPSITWEQSFVYMLYMSIYH